MLIVQQEHFLIYVVPSRYLDSESEIHLFLEFVVFLDMSF